MSDISEVVEMTPIMLARASGDGVMSYEAPREPCVTPGNPYVLHCFPAFDTALTREHHTHLDLIAEKIAKSFRRSGRPITRVGITGHSSTWHGTSRRKLQIRAIQRAGNAAGALIIRLDDLGLGKRVLVEAVGRSDRETWRSIPYSSTSTSNAERKKRALNRRVEITLLRKQKPQCSDRDLAKSIHALNLKVAVNARREPRFETNLHRKAVICMRSKLTSKLLDGDPIDDRFTIRWKGLDGTKRPTPIWRSFSEELRRICETKGSISENDFIKIYNRLVNPIAHLPWEITKLLADLTPNPFGGPSLKEIKQAIQECQVVEPIYRKCDDWNSLYWCLRGWIRPAFRVCFEGPGFKISPF